MNHLETPAFNEWLDYLKEGRLQPTLFNAQLMIVMCGLANNTTKAQQLAHEWLDQAVELGVLKKNPASNVPLIKEGN